MVRFKGRWFLVRADMNEQSKDGAPEEIISKLTLFKAIRRSIQKNFGGRDDPATIRIIEGLSVKHLDMAERLVMIRAARDSFKIVRAAIDRTNQIVSASSGRSHPIALSVISINGSARTAKRASISVLRKRAQSRGKSTKDQRIELEARIEKLLSIN